MHLQTPCGRLVRKIVLFMVFGLIVSAVPHSHAGLIHQYQFNGTFADDLGGPDLVPAGGTLGATSYAFGVNQGLSLSNGLTDPANYSIELVFNFSSLTGYRKILDFKNLGPDTGLYDFNTALNFYNVTTSAAGAFSPRIDVRLVATRNDTTDQFVGYINGTQRIAFTDNAGLAVFTAANNIIHFFKDDVATGEREVSAGVVDLIRIYDAPLSASEIASLSDPVSTVPEPSTLFLLVSAVGLLGVGRLRQQRKTGD